MFSRIKCGKDELRGLPILGNISAKKKHKKKIQNHALQEVRNKESWLKYLAAATLE
jgi:hypothetical protein